MNEIEKLQEQISFQEDTIEKLNLALIKQQEQIQRLSEKQHLIIKLLQQWQTDNPDQNEQSNNVGEISQEIPQEIPHEIPPHY